MSEPSDIRGWQRLDHRTTTSGRILAADLDRLQAIGVRHVINLALDTHPEALADEAGECAARGMDYTHIPVPFDAPGDDHFARFINAIEAADGPIHVHCIMNYRVSAFFYRYHRDIAGMAEEQARALMAQQWDPTGTGQPEAAAWADFVTRRSAS